MATVFYVPTPPKDLVDNLDEYFKHAGAQQKEIWRVKWRGEYMVLNGKTVWTSSGPARTAFHRIFHHSQTIRDIWKALHPESIEAKKSPYSDQTREVVIIRPDLYKKFVYELELAGILEFVKSTQK